MSKIRMKNMSFFYEVPYKEVFEGLNVEIDTTWRLGLVGRNGSGKTTLMKLIQGELKPSKGIIECDTLFSNNVNWKDDDSSTVIDIIKNSVAPFEQWEYKMNKLLGKGDDEALAEYAKLLEQFHDAKGYEIHYLIEKELNLIGLETVDLKQQYNQLSMGQKEKLKIVSLFLKNDYFVILDEPTNHLDIEGRKIIADYLKTKKGFLCISHDRSVLDACCDHVIALTKSGVDIVKGNYSTYRMNKKAHIDFELKSNVKIKREIKGLKQDAVRRRNVSRAIEATKIGQGACDRGNIGHKSAKMMQLAKNVEKRINDKLDEKSELLHDLQKQYDIKIETNQEVNGELIIANNLYKSYGEKEVVKDISFTLHKGDRLAIIGGNGSGKSTLVKMITGELLPSQGCIKIPKYIALSYAKQRDFIAFDSLDQYIESNGYDVTLFRQVLGALGVKDNIFMKDCNSFSQGEMKKINLVSSICDEAHILVWDEPFNYLDIESREIIENAILKYNPTMIFVEHDRYFVEKVATDKIVI